LIFGLRRACVQHLINRDTQAVMDLSERLVAASTKYETFKGRLDGTIFRSLAQLQTRWDATYLEQLMSGIRRLDAAKNWIMLPFFMACAAETIGHHDASAQASALLDRADELIRLTGEYWCEPEVLRLRSRFGANSPTDGIILLQDGLRKAGKQQAKLWELRCAMDLMRVCSGEGQKMEAHASLASIYASFEEGSETPDLAAARSLLQSA
jgi:hypothetical protein